MNTTTDQPATLWVYDPYDPDFRKDPHPYYHSLRTNSPVHWSDALGIWVVSPYDLVHSLLRDGRLSHRDPFFGIDPAHLAEVGGDLPQGEDLETIARIFSRIVAFQDAPDLQRLRGLVNRVFTARAVAPMKHRMQQITDDLVSAFVAHPEPDVIRDVAQPLPERVMCGLMGIPASDHDEFAAHVAGLASIADPRPPVEALKRGFSSFLWLVKYFDDLLIERRKKPSDDLLGALVAAEEAGDRLDRDELLAMSMAVFIAGLDTTTHLIGNGMLALLRNPDQLRLWQNNPQITETAVEELLRYDGPVQTASAPRRATVDMQVGDQTIKEGDPVRLLIAAANRDPQRFEDPDTLNLVRPDNQHLAFGPGLHFCLGAALARAETQIAFQTILANVTDIEQSGDITWKQDSVVIRGLRTLPVAIGKH